LTTFSSSNLKKIIFYILKSKQSGKREKSAVLSFLSSPSSLSLLRAVATVAAQQAPQHTTQAGAAAAGRNNAHAGGHSGITAAAVMAAGFQYGVY